MHEVSSPEAAPARGFWGRFVAYFLRIGRFRRNARLYLWGTLLMGVGQGALWVHLNLYFRALGLGEAVIGRILSAGSFGTVLIAVPAALWVDRVPAQRIFTLAAGGFAVMFAVMLLAHSVWVIAAASFSASMLFTIHWVAAAPFFMRNASEDDRIYLFGFANAVETLATIVAAIGAGAVARHLTRRLGSELLGMRYTLLGVALVSVFAVVFFARIRSVAPRAARPRLREYLLARDWRLLGKLTLPGFLIGMGAGLIIPFLNLYFRDRFGQDPREIGAFFAVSQFLTMLGFLAGAPLARRMGAVRSIVLTEALSIPFFLILALTRDLSMAVFAFWMRGALMNMNAPISNNFAMEVVEPAEQTSTNSVRMLAWNVSWMVSAQTGGWLIQRRGFTAPMFLTIGLYAVSAALFYLFFRRYDARAGALARSRARQTSMEG
jgi:predicted MFS family arabinose efflux permease